MSDQPSTDPRSPQHLPAKRNYVGWAFVTLVLYYLFWLPGFVANIILWRSASRTQRLSGQKPAGKGCLFLLLICGIALPLLLILSFPLRTILQPFRVDGTAMYPTLRTGDFLIATRVGSHSSLPHRGDIIVFKYPGDTTRDFIERVIGLPGDTVQVAHEIVSLNHVPLSEPYIPLTQRPGYDFGPYTVPPGVVFTLGDNRNNSYDGHAWGMTTPLTDNLIVGKVVLIYWPPARFSTAP